MIIYILNTYAIAQVCAANFYIFCLWFRTCHENLRYSKTRIEAQEITSKKEGYLWYNLG